MEAGVFFVRAWFDARWQRHVRWRCGGGLGLDAERFAGLDAIDHLQVVRPSFGPVFPRMRGGVGGDVVLLPVGRRSLLVVAGEGAAVVKGVVAKELTEGGA